MKQLIKIFLIVILSIQFTTCHKYPRKGESGNHGDIIDSYKLPDCYGPKSTNADADEYIIKSFDDLDTSASYYNCVKGQPNLDFNTYSVIGKTTRGDCNVKIRRELKIDHESKQYIYTISFKDRGICKKLALNNNLVIVPKIPNDYTVVFNVKEDGLIK